MAYKELGVDVSGIQLPTNWATAKANGVKFAIIKAGEGTTYKSPALATHVNGCNNNSIPFGLYHIPYFQYGRAVEEAEKEANYFIKIIKGYKPKLPIYADLEEACLDKRRLSKRETTDCVHRFCQTLEKAGYFAGVYGNKNIWDNYVFGEELAKRYTYWASSYGTNSENPNPNTVSNSMTATRKKYAKIWQFTSKGKITGINGHVDRNFMYEDYPTIIVNAGYNGHPKTSKTPPAPAPTPAKPKPPVYKPPAARTPIPTKNVVVKKGDTLWCLAATHLGAGYRYPEIKKLNGFTTDLLVAGTTIKIQSSPSQVVPL